MLFLRILHFRARFRIEEHIYLCLFRCCGSLSQFLSRGVRELRPGRDSNGKVLLNGPWANSYNDFVFLPFRRDHHRRDFRYFDTAGFPARHLPDSLHQADFEIRLPGGRWAGSFVTTRLRFSGMIVREPMPALSRPGQIMPASQPNHLWWYLQPFLSIIVVQIFFLGSLFFAVRALTRKIFIVYLQGVAVFMVYVIGSRVSSATRSLEHFWSGIFDRWVYHIRQYYPLLDGDREEYSLLPSWISAVIRPGVFLYNRLLWAGCWIALFGRPVGVLSHVGRSLTARSQGKTRREGAPAGSGRGSAACASGCRPAAARPSAVRRWNLFRAVPLAHAAAHPTICSEIPFWAMRV